MTPLEQARESAWSILGIVARCRARVGEAVRVSQLAPVVAANPALSLKAGIAYAVGQGWIRDWGRAVILTKKGLAASAALAAPKADAGLDRSFRSIMIPPRPAARKPTASRG